MNGPLLPADVRTERLHMRRWRAGDAAVLLPILSANFDHLDAWIPRHVAEPSPLPELTRRLDGFARDFDANRQWRYCILSSDTHDILGEVSVFPRDRSGRTDFAAADRVEIGYWLRADVTGRGLATEASRAMIALTSALPRVRRIEIRCDDRNAPSVAIPRRLGFSLEPPADDDDSHGMVWFLDVP